jgi:clan AA aspartic protease
MGFTYVKAKVCNPAEPSRCIEVELLVDTGAIYTVIEKQKLKEIGIEPYEKREFNTVDNRTIEREVGGIIIELEGRKAHTVAIFGENDKSVLGVTTLEELGLEVDPITKKLKPMALLLV